MGLPQYQNQEDLILKSAYYMGTATLVQGNAVIYDTDPVACLPATKFSGLAPFQPFGDQLDNLQPEELLGRAVQDVGYVSNNNGTAGTINLTGGQFAGVVIQQPPENSGVFPPVTTGPCSVVIARPLPGAVIPILVNYNNAAVGDVVVPDYSTPSNTFGPEVPLGSLYANYPLNIASTLTFAQNNTSGTVSVIQAGNGSPYPTMGQAAAGRFVLMQSGPATGVSATAPTLLIAKAL
jgi:hypothetical protein